MLLRKYSGPIFLSLATVSVGVVVYLVHEQQTTSILEMRKGVERDKERIEAKRRSKALAATANQSSPSAPSS